MKELNISLGIACLLILAFEPHPTSAVFNNICRLFKDGQVLRDPYACDSYITCVNSVGVSTKCPKGQQYSVTKEKCMAGVDSCDDPCAPDNDNMWAADSKSCNGFYYCNQGAGVFGVCPTDLHFHEDNQECVYTKDSLCNATTHNNNYCHFIPDDVKFLDEEFCDKYKMCAKRKLTSGSCTSGKLFDRALGDCDFRVTEGDNCRELPKNVCKSAKNKFVSDDGTCRGYYYCVDKGKNEVDTNPSWGQCSEGLFFDASSQSCVDPLLVYCDKDRCDGRPDMFVNSSKNCQWYLTCRGGATISERQCADHKFFDEKRQVCTSELIEYKGCSPPK